MVECEKIPGWYKDNDGNNTIGAIIMTITPTLQDLGVVSLDKQPNKYTATLADGYVIVIPRDDTAAGITKAGEQLYKEVVRHRNG